ncbi:helix-turn-helix transcriptional regulator [Gordonia shandongensis]|uniref:helix-turn-helix transcriptional regulator n=1 Tax=Gordonia shandongensis TaxID=376351 RepID=UPI00068868D4|nr:WYL domain-containing protein [Gordonia shandongensis]
MSARQFVTADFIRENVIGYSGGDQQADSFKRMLERDKRELREMGIPVETGRNPSGEEGYRINPDEYSLPDITLDPDEAAAVAAASAVWHEPEVAAVFQTALLKLRAAGVEVRQDDELAVSHGAATRSVGDERVIGALLSAIDARRSVRFTHRTVRGRSERSLEPWGVVSHTGRWYVVGHDLDRDATRTFRISRVTDVRADSAPGAVRVPSDIRLTDIVAEAVAEASEAAGSTAQVWVAADRAHGLRRIAETAERHEHLGEAGDLLTIAIRSRSGLKRLVLAAGPDAVVQSPDDLRAEVIADLDRLIAQEAAS